MRLYFLSFLLTGHLSSLSVNIYSVIHRNGAPCVFCVPLVLERQRRAYRDVLAASLAKYYLHKLYPSNYFSDTIDRFSKITGNNPTPTINKDAGAASIKRSSDANS